MLCFLCPALAVAAIVVPAAMLAIVMPAIVMPAVIVRSSLCLVMCAGGGSLHRRARRLLAVLAHVVTVGRRQSGASSPLGLYHCLHPTSLLT